MKHKFLLKTMLLLCALIAGSGSAWADNWNYTFNASSGISKGSNTLNGEDWNIEHDSSYENNEPSGYHVGSSSKTVSYLQLSTSGISGKITKIVVNAKGNGTGGTISASVDGSAYAAKDNNTSITNNPQDFEFTGFSSGEIIIRLAYGSAIKKNFYVSSITITYEIPVTGVSLASTLSVQEGSTETLTATVSPNNATIKDITWSSEDESIATVSSTGVVTGVAAGTTTIWATSDYDNTKKASCTVTVTAASDTRTAVNLTGFSANQTTLVVGGTTNTTATNDQNGWTAAYTYGSDNTDVATVDANGVITAVAKGSATITCSLNVNPSDANYKAGLTNSMTVDITVTKPFHTVTFSVNGNTSRTASVEEDELITFPTNIPDENGKKFMGWYTEAYTNATTSPAYVNTATTTMGNSNVTYYAVFADGTTTYSETETETSTLAYDTWTYEGTTTNKSGYRLFAENAYIVSGTFDLSSLKEVDVYAGTYGTISDNDKKKVSVVAGQTTWGTATLSTNSQSTKNEITSSVSLSGNGQLHIVAGGGDGSNTGIRISQVDIITKKATTTYGNYCTSVVLTYSVTYDGNGNTSGSVPTDNAAYTSGQSVTVAGNTGSLAKTGYAFGGWNTQADGLGTNYAANATFNITANTTLYAKWNVKTITGLSYTGTPTKTTYSAGESFDPTGLTVTATYNDASQEDVTASVTWTPDPLTVGTTSVTGTYMEQTVNVSGLTVTAAAGSEANPYTVAQAISNTPSSGTSSEVYIHGIVSAFYSSTITGDATYHRYYISDDGTTSSQLMVFNGKLKENTAFSSDDDLRVGDIVTIYGGLTTYNSTKEVAANNYIVSHKLVAPTFSVAAGAVTSGTTVTISDAHTGSTIYYTTDGTNPTNESSVYSSPISITSATTLKAIAVKSGYTTSDVAEAAYTINVTPTISLSSYSVETTCAETDGSLTVTCANIDTDTGVEIVWYTDNTASSTTTEPDWIKTEITTTTLNYEIGANTGDARTAYFKVYGLDEGANDVYSELVTISQAAYVAPLTPNNWVAANLADINANDVFVIVGNDGSSTYTMNNNYGTTYAPKAIAITVSGSRLVGEIADSIQWNLGGNASNGYTFYPKGSTTTWLYCTTTAASSSNNNMRVGTGDRKVFKMENSYLLTKDNYTDRYVSIYNGSDWRGYTSTSTTAPTTLAFYKKLAAKLNGNGYATFSATVPVDFSDDSEFSAWVIKSITGTAITFEKVTGSVPANTGVLLKGTAGETVYPTATASGTAPETNLLTAVATATTVDANAYYGLSGATFVKVNEGKVPAGKALLPKSVVEGSGVKAFTFVFEDDATAIKDLNDLKDSKNLNDVIYNLAGQRMNKMQKGINIVNGKKIMY